MCLLAPNLAPTWRPRSLQSRPRVAQETSKSAQEPPKTDQEPPRTAQEPPKTAQEPPKSRPRCPGAAQDLTRSRPGPPRSALDPTPYPRLEKKPPNFTTQSFRTSFRTTKRPKTKTSGGGTPPKGVFNPPPLCGRRARLGIRGLLELSRHISSDIKFQN